MARVHFVVPGRTVGVNATYRRGKGRRLYKTDEAIDWREQIRRAAIVAMGSAEPFPGPCSLQVRWFFHSPLCDNDGPIKPLKDALQEIVYLNDRQVKVERYEWDHDPENPRCEVTVDELIPVTVTVDAEAVARERKALLACVSPKARAGVLTKRAVSSKRDYR